jgi:hypothetical protein
MQFTCYPLFRFLDSFGIKMILGQQELQRLAGFRSEWTEALVYGTVVIAFEPLPQSRTDLEPARLTGLVYRNMVTVQGQLGSANFNFYAQRLTFMALNSRRRANDTSISADLRDENH